MLLRILPLCAARGQRIARPACSVEVMVVAPAADGAGAGGADPDAPPPAHAKKSTRTRGPVLERVGAYPDEAGPSDPPPRPSRLEATIENLNQAYVPGADVLLCAQQVEEQRLFVLEEAQKVAAQKRELERSQREYASANGLAPVSRLAGRLGDVGVRGKNLHSELDRAARSGSQAMHLLVTLHLGLSMIPLLKTLGQPRQLQLNLVA